MSESETTVPTTTEETPAETPAATTEETPAATTEETPATTTEETPAATTEETPAATEETPAATTKDDQPAVTEVTEVTTEVTVETEEQPKEKEAEEAPKKEKEPKKPKAAKVLDYRTSKAGWVQRQGLIFKKWQRLYMCLDEEDSVLRWWKRDNKTSSDGALYMKYCADVSEPKAEATTTWPDDTANRCFVVCSPFRANFLVAESQEERDDWIQKLTAAKDKYNTEGRKVISTELISFKSSSGASDFDKALKDEGVVKEKTEDTPATEATTEEPPAGGENEAVTVEVDVETPTSPDPPKDETPAEEAPKDETPATAEGEAEKVED